MDSSKLENVINQMIYLDTLRGTDGTGIAILGKDPKVLPNVYKKAIPGFDFVDTTLYDKVTKNFGEIRGILAHNRAATKGSINNASTHPFQHGDITLAHNGTLFFHAMLDGKSTVDSERIAETFAVKDIKETLEKLDGAYALVWHSAVDGTINFARNKERPLYLAFTKDKDVLMWASEAWMITVAASRAGVTLEEVGPWELKVGEWNSVQLGGADFAKWDVIPFLTKSIPINHGGKAGNTQIVTTPGTTKNNVLTLPAEKKIAKANSALKALDLTVGELIMFEIYKKTPYNGYPSMGTVEGWYQDDKDSTAMATIIAHGVNMESKDLADPDFNKKTFIGKIKSAVQNNSWITVYVDQIEAIEEVQEEADGDDDYSPFVQEAESSGRFYKGPRGTYVSEAQFRTLAEDGCVKCSGPVFPKDDCNVVWTSDGRPYCPQCVNDYDAMGYLLVDAE
jgi:predicted glutamine amidotransferase